MRASILVCVCGIALAAFAIGADAGMSDWRCTVVVADVPESVFVRLEQITDRAASPDASRQVSSLLDGVNIRAVGGMTGGSGWRSFTKGNLSIECTGLILPNSREIGSDWIVRFDGREVSGRSSNLPDGRIQIRRFPDMPSLVAIVKVERANGPR